MYVDSLLSRTEVGGAEPNACDYILINYLYIIRNLHHYFPYTIHAPTWGFPLHNIYTFG